jgi:hypothetical protein
MTGAQFYTLLQQKIDKAYSAYIDTTKADRIIEDTIYRLCERTYRDLDAQKDYDELWSLLIKDEVKTVGAPYIDLSGLDRTYMHLFRVACTYKTLLGSLTRVTTGSGPYTTVFSSSGHSARVGDSISVLTVTGTVTATTKLNFTITSAATIDGSAPVFLVRTFEASPYYSDRKRDVYHTPTIFHPKYQLQNRVVGTVNNKSLYLFPQADSITIDYFSQPTIATGHIFLSTGATQITAYTEKFLYRLADECVMTYAGQVRDTELRQSSAQDIAINP